MSHYNPLWPFFLLLMGIVAAALTTLWVLHVLVYMFFYPPESQFLNKYFIQVNTHTSTHTPSTPRHARIANRQSVSPMPCHALPCPPTPNSQQFDAWFPLFGVLSVAIFTLYLLFCVVAGNFKLGVRFLCVELHPMKVLYAPARQAQPIVWLAVTDHSTDPFHPRTTDQRHLHEQLPLQPHPHPPLHLPHRRVLHHGAALGSNRPAQATH